MTNKEKEIELPEVQEFLKITRNYVRQLKIIKKSNISGKFSDVLDNSIQVVLKESIRYIEEK